MIVPYHRTFFFLTKFLLFRCNKIPLQEKSNDLKRNKKKGGGRGQGEERKRGKKGGKKKTRKKKRKEKGKEKKESSLQERWSHPYQTLENPITGLFHGEQGCITAFIHGMNFI